MKRLFKTLLCLAALSVVRLSAAEKPNVVLILADDLGYGDLRCYNAASKIPTPHLDRLAAQGMRFTDAHTPSAVCTPTRYGLLTGRYCWRTWLKEGVLDGFDPPLIEPGRATIASFLKSLGYSTACVGKWHLGMTWTTKAGAPVEYRGGGHAKFRAGEDVDFTREMGGGPRDCGFDSYFGISASLDMSPYGFIEGRRMTTPPSEPTVEEKSLFVNQVAGVKSPGFELDGVLPALTRRAVAAIDSRAVERAPFFLFLPLNSPHLPVVPGAAWRGKSGAGLYGDFVMETDAAVGEILAALDRAKLADDTLVIVTSDNGGLWHTWPPQERDDLAGYKPTPRGQYNAEHGQHSNGELRGTKADIYEGGHRVPFLVRWPGKVKASAVSDALIELNDIFATLADITGTALPRDAAGDSFSFLPVITVAPTGGRPRTFAVHHSLNGVFALREGPWKYVPSRGSGGFSTPKTVIPKAGESPAQLYDLSTDPHETRNLAATHPDIATRLATRLAEILKTPDTRRQTSP